MKLLEEQIWMPYKTFIIYALILLGLLLLRRLLSGGGSGSGGQPALDIGNGQTIGTRAEQDDYFSTIVNPKGTIAVLADGISGLSGGRLASTTAVGTFIKEFLKQESLHDIAGFFTQTAKLSNREVMRSLKGAQGGTTLAAVIIADGYLYWGAVGDSLIKIFRNGEFIEMNHKHTLESVLEERYVAGEITRHEALESPMKNRLINYLGYEGFKNIEICEAPFPLHKQDKVILCSDGVYDTLTELELEHILTQPLSAYDAAQQIIEAVERKRLAHQDNATVIILEKGW